MTESVAKTSTGGETATRTVAAPRRTGRWITTWDPEDETFWDGGGRQVARRNLIVSIIAEHIGFSVWMLWSIVAVHLNKVGFAFSDSELFWLVAIPSLVGATLRIPYTFAVPLVGGRNWTVISASLLLIPVCLLAWAVSNPGTSFTVMMVVAATAGFGGGNFASSMSNISYFFPEREKGWALGLNAAGGNIGVAVVQAPVVVTAIVLAGGGIHLERAGLMWIPLIIIAAVLGWRFMDNLAPASVDLKSSAGAAKHAHTWVMSLLYVGTFGSFIGYSAAFPLLITTQFPGVAATNYAFLGALVGSLARPFGGKIADRLGGARVTAGSFVVMGLGVLGAVYAVSLGSFGLFLMSFTILFVATGVGNGATYRMIPAIFRSLAGEAGGSAPVLTRFRAEAAAAIGIIAAIGAYGGFLVPRTYAWSTASFGSIVPALYLSVGVYVLMCLLTWACYLRPGARMAAARV